jgi:ABC-type tungstate transport system permease subunit
MPSSVEAFSRIAVSGAAFVSRADDSGTNKKELELWEAGGGTPQGAVYMKSVRERDGRHVAYRLAEGRLHAH